MYCNVLPPHVLSQYTLHTRMYFTLYCHVLHPAGAAWQQATLGSINEVGSSSGSSGVRTDDGAGCSSSAPSRAPTPFIPLRVLNPAECSELQPTDQVAFARKHMLQQASIIGRWL